MTSRHILCLFLHLTTLILVIGLPTPPILDVGYNDLSAEKSSLSVHVNSSCPSWYFPSSNGCTCGSRLGPLVRCENGGAVLVRIGYCMSVDQSSQQTLVGNCPYVNDYIHKSSSFIKQSKNESHLNNELCSWANRTGFMCSRCNEGLGISVMTYDHKCIQCIGKLKGWILYLFLATAPTSFFFLLVLSCRIRSTSAYMNAVVCIFQVMLFYVDKYPYTVASGIGNKIGYYLLVAVETVGGVWNLDFLRYVIPPFCISEHLSTLNVIAMEYIVAIYPLVLIGFTYICVEQYDKDFRPLLIMWSPFKWLLKKLSWKVDFRPSIIDAFATFLHLTYSKLIFVSFNLLSFVAPYNARGEHIYPNVLYYNAEIPFLSKVHVPYFILSITVLLIFVVFPMILLMLYPTKTFQKCLGLFPTINWHPLHAFADAFNGCYKNGTNGTRDYRYFGAFYLVVRVLFYLPSVISEVESGILVTTMPLIISLMFGVLKPYKQNICNGIDALLFALLEFNQILKLYDMYSYNISWVLQGAFASLPFFYLLLVITYKAMSLCFPKLLEDLVTKFCYSLKSGIIQEGREMLNACHDDNRIVEGDPDSNMPDRMRNPANYQPLTNICEEASKNIHQQHVAFPGSYGSVCNSAENNVAS